jgi:hypothetical protein
MTSPGECRHGGRWAGQREADLEGDPRQEDRAADPGDADQRTGTLADGQAGQWHAPEREAEPQCLGERVRRRPSDHAPSAGRRDHRGNTVEPSEEGGGEQISGSGEEPHPCQSGNQPASCEQPPAPKSSASIGTLAERRLEHDDAQEGEWPEAPWRQREGDENPADQGQERLLRRTADGWHRPATLIVSTSSEPFMCSDPHAYVVGQAF